MPLRLPGEESGWDEPGNAVERHHHWHAYAALVVRGSCEEAGDHGRFRARAGDVLVHRAFDAHKDQIGPRGAAFLNFRLEAPLDGWFGSVADVDAIFRAYRSDRSEALALLRAQFRPAGAVDRDWPDLLASELASGKAPSLAQWADRHGLHPASLSRGFRMAYGLSPKRFRLEAKASRAARHIRRGGASLAAVAADTGFADQAHMTRTLARLFGASPLELRARG
jgi:AraC-like DNA-binding protein